jgi:hypothetical protein
MGPFEVLSCRWKKLTAAPWPKKSAFGESGLKNFNDRQTDSGSLDRYSRSATVAQTVVMTDLYLIKGSTGAVFQTAADLGAWVIAFVTLQSVYSYSDCATRISTVLSNVQGFPHLVM